MMCAICEGSGKDKKGICKNCQGTGKMVVKQNIYTPNSNTKKIKNVIEKLAESCNRKKDEERKYR